MDYGMLCSPDPFSPPTSLLSLLVYYCQFFQRWVPQKAKKPVQGGPQGAHNQKKKKRSGYTRLMEHFLHVPHYKLQSLQCSARKNQWLLVVLSLMYHLPYFMVI